MNKTKNPITRSYKKKKKTIRERNRLFPLFSCTRTRTFISNTSNDPGWCFACTKGGRICPEWCEQFDRGCESSREQIRLRIPVRDGPRATRPTYKETTHTHTHTHRFRSYPREDQRFKAVGASTVVRETRRSKRVRNRLVRSVMKLDNWNIRRYTLEITIDPARCAISRYRFCTRRYRRCSDRSIDLISDVGMDVFHSLWAIRPFSLANNRLRKKFIAASVHPVSQWTWTRVTERRITAIGYRIGFFHTRDCRIFHEIATTVYIYIHTMVYFKFNVIKNRDRWWQVS